MQQPPPPPQRLSNNFFLPKNKPTQQDVQRADEKLSTIQRQSRNPVCHGAPSQWGAEHAVNPSLFVPFSLSPTSSFSPGSVNTKCADDKLHTMQWHSQEVLLVRTCSETPSLSPFVSESDTFFLPKINKSRVHSALMESYAQFSDSVKKSCPSLCSHLMKHKMCRKTLSLSPFLSPTSFSPRNIRNTSLHLSPLTPFPPSLSYPPPPTTTTSPTPSPR